MNNFQELLAAKFLSHDASITIVGAGYVGLPLGLAFINAGFIVYIFDIDDSKIESLTVGKSYIKHIRHESIRSALDTRRFLPTTEPHCASQSDAIIVCVPTPLDKHRQPDLTCIKNSLHILSPYLKKYQLLSLESTTYPGTTEDVILPYLKDRGFTVGIDYALVYSPEREDPGNKNFSVNSIPKLVGGVTSSCTDLGFKLYGEAIATVIPVKNPRIAEMAKLLENVHRAVNIGLVNELKPLATALDIDIYDVISAASTKPFGFVPYYPGPGLGGHCIPIDPFYLTWKAREYDIHTRFIELAGEINARMPSYVVSNVISQLNSRGKSLSSSTILCLGLAYKKDVDDIRESPSLKIIQMLLGSGSSVRYHDPYCKGVTNHPMFGTRCIDEVHLYPDIIQSSDLTLLLTDHTDIDYGMIYEYSDIIVDTRGKYPIDSKVVRS